MVGGQRVPENHPRLEAYGTVDELMSFTAYLRDNLDDTPRLSPYRDDLLAVLDHLMRAASHLATEGEAPKYLPEFGPEKALFLENPDRRHAVYAAGDREIHAARRTPGRIAVPHLPHDLPPNGTDRPDPV